MGLGRDPAYFMGWERLAHPPARSRPPTKELAMYIVATHTISNPDKFWSAAKTLSVPAHLKLRTVWPSTDGAKASCLWEGDSLPTVKEFVETITSGLATNEYMVVEAANAVGLPK
jgi:hypothetical protein